MAVSYFSVPIGSSAKHNNSRGWRQSALSKGQSILFGCNSSNFTTEYTEKTDGRVDTHKTADIDRQSPTRHQQIVDTRALKPPPTQNTLCPAAS